MRRTIVVLTTTMKQLMPASGSLALTLLAAAGLAVLIAAISM